MESITVPSGGGGVDVPVDHLDYKYIQDCKNVKELEKIIKVLRSGKEGTFPALEAAAEKRLASLNPHSRILRKESPLINMKHLPKDEYESIMNDMQSWTSSMKTEDTLKAQVDMENTENQPPVRGQAASIPVTKEVKQEEKKTKKKKRVKPRDYREWDKVDVDAELQKIDDDDEKVKVKENTNVLRSSAVPNIPSTIDTTDMNESEITRRAELEKNKGNEAFYASDYPEALVYYSRSLSLRDTVAARNNRAQAYIKTEEWDKAVRDSDDVLKREPENMKALLRRAVGNKGRRKYADAKKDLLKVLAKEENNKRAKDVLAEVDKALSEVKVKGHRMVIEETSGSEDEEEEKQEKPMVNGNAHHDKEPQKPEEPSRTRIQIEEESDSESEEEESSATEKSNPTKPENLSKEADKSAERITNSGNGGEKSDKNQEKLKSFEQVKEELDQFRDKYDKMHEQTDKINEGFMNVIEQGLKDIENGNVPELDKVDDKNRDEEVDISGVKVVLDTDSSGDKETVRDEKSDGGKNSEIVEKSTEQDKTTSEQTSSDSPQKTISEQKSQDSNARNAAASTPEAKAKETPPEPEVVAPAPPPPLPGKVLKLKEQGNTLFKNGDYSGAVEIYDKAITALVKDPAQAPNLAILYSNRSACKHKLGDCTGCVKDCTEALNITPGAQKPLLRRAMAYEALERYMHAYVDFREILYYDSTVDMAHQGSTRCSQMMQITHGPNWRSKLPPMKFSRPTPNYSPLAHLNSQQFAIKDEKKQSITQAPTTAETGNKVEEKIPSPEEEFERLKCEGNEYVKKADFHQAISTYSQCIALCPDRAVPYTNRALCYLRLNQPSKVMSDCDKALELEPDNVKALFRRGQAHKMLKDYTASARDFVKVLQLDKKNVAADKELKLVLQYKKEQDAKKKTESPKKKENGKRMKIQEVNSDESQAKPNKASKQKDPPQQSTKQNTKASPVKQASQTGSKQPKQTSTFKFNANDVSEPVKVKDPQLSKAATPYEFLSAWASLKGKKSIDQHYKLLQQVEPEVLPKVISNKLDGDMLQTIMRCVGQLVKDGQSQRGHDYLRNLATVPRFEMTTMFMSNTDKQELKTVLADMEKSVSPADVKKLHKSYGL